MSHPATTVSYDHDHLMIAFPDCMPGDYELDSDAPYEIRYWVAEGDGAGRSVNCIKGEISVQQCSQSHVRLRFWCEFPDGSTVNGAAATDLEFDLGYD